MGGEISIGEFSRRSGLSVSALRFYDERSLFRPTRVDHVTGYRFYAEAQLEDAGLIRDLRRLQMPLRTLAAFLVAPAAERERLLLAHMATLTEQLDEAARLATRLRTETQPKEATMRLTVPARELHAAIDQVLPAVGTDPERPVLTCMLIELKDGSLRFVGTDSHRLAVRDLPVRGTTEEFAAVVPGAALRRLLPRLNEDASTRVDVKDGRFTVATDDGEDGAYLVQATFPAYEQLLAADAPEHVIQTDRADLVRVLERVGQTAAVGLTFTRQSLVVTNDDTAVEVAAHYEGAGFDVAVDPRYALYAASAAVGPDIVLEATQPLKPVTFRSADDGTFVCLVMPIRIASSAP